MLKNGTLYYIRKEYLLLYILKNITLYYVGRQSYIVLINISLVEILKGIGLTRV